jgi:hypothetical protein
MRKARFRIIGSTGGVAAGVVLAASVWAQEPQPTPGPVPPPVPATSPAPMAPAAPMRRADCEPGPFQRARNHVWRTLQNNFIGYPEEFVEPPLGFYNREIVSVMRAKADPHRFTMYRSDFLAGTSQLSPNGAMRFNLIASRLRSCALPMVIEWSPDQPGLAEARRAAVLAMLQGTGMPVVPERVVIGPSNYPGLLGTDAANNYNAMSTRYSQAPTSYSLPPSSSGGSFSSGGP